MFRPLIEKKLSRLLGAQVTFGNLSISLFRGTVEANDMIVVASSVGRPLLRVKYIKAELSISKAMSGQIAIKSLVIQQPVATIIFNADGTTNLPPAISFGGNDSPATPAPAPPASTAPANDSAPAASSSLPQFSMQDLRLTDGQLHLQDETGGSAYHVSAEQISMQVQEHGTQTAMNLNIESFARRDRALPLPPVKISGSFGSACELSHLLKAQFQAELTCGDRCRMTITSPGVGSRKGSLEIAVKTVLKELLELVPPRLPLPAILSTLQGSGPVELNAQIEMNGTTVGLKKLQLTLGDLQLN